MKDMLVDDYKGVCLKVSSSRREMEEQQLNPLAVTHLLQHTLRSLCLHENSQWVYAVFWRILPRNYPPPKWEGQGGYERSRGNRRNWILVWEDGFCNFAASTAVEPGDQCHEGSSSVYANCEFQGLQPELFFKMSHEIYNYGEGVVGKVAADYSHKWIYKEPSDQEINFLSAWHNSADSHPRTWEAQFRSGIKTIALIAVREGVVQLGSLHKVIEDLSYVVLLRKRFSYIESIPGVLLPHPSSSASPPPYPFRIDAYNADTWHLQAPFDNQFYDPNTGLVGYHQPPGAGAMKITPSMNSLEALLSKLPSVVPPPGVAFSHPSDHHFVAQTPLEFMGSGQEKMAKEEEEEEVEDEYKNIHSHHHHHQYHHLHLQNRHLNATSSTTDNRF